jgi:hypothetical protein
MPSKKSKPLCTNTLNDRSRQALRGVCKFTSGHGYHVVIDLYEIATRYVSHLHHSDHGVAAYLKENGISLSDDEVEAAWWVMQLRGITWNFSTWHPDDVVPQVLGQSVPSSFDGNKTPVWITQWRQRRRLSCEASKCMSRRRSGLAEAGHIGIR